MKKLFRYITISSKYVVVLTIIFSIVANGAFAGQRVEKENKNNIVLLDEAQLQQGPPSPDELPLNMETSSKPETEQPAYLKAVQTLKTDNNQSRFKLNKEKSKQILKEYLNSDTQKTIISTTSQVCSSLGRQFRLVGAKPSGTS